MSVSMISRTPRVRTISPRSVAQNDPLPGLSMIGSPGDRLDPRAGQREIVADASA
jgi:hypothetical protein